MDLTWLYWQWAGAFILILLLGNWVITAADHTGVGAGLTFLQLFGMVLVSGRYFYVRRLRSALLFEMKALEWWEKGQSGEGPP